MTSDEAMAICQRRADRLRALAESERVAHPRAKSSPLVYRLMVAASECDACAREIREATQSEVFT